MSGSETEQKIIEAAIRCIETRGIKKTTVRQIAAQAGVNLAAVNYHFGSKEGLISRVKEETLANAFDMEQLKNTRAMEPKERFIALMTHMAKGMLEFPNITRAHFYHPFLEGECGSEIVQMFKVYTGRLSGELDFDRKEAAKAMVLQVFSIIFCTVMMPDLFYPGDNKALRDDALLEGYIRSIAGRY